MWDVALRPSRDALQRATDRHGRFASLAVAFTMLGPSVVFYIDDLVGVQSAALAGMLYLGAVVWAFMHERELQRQVEDIRAEREAVNTVQTAPENMRTRQPRHLAPEIAAAD
jgi:hypothetical protein